MKIATWILGAILAVVGYAYFYPETTRTVSTNGECLTYAQYQNGKIKLHVFDMSEFSTTLTSTSCVNRTLYFVYTNKYSVGSGTETRTYQHNHEFSVYPKYYTADSTYRNEQGQIVLPIDDFAVHTNESDVYYVIPFTKSKEECEQAYKSKLKKAFFAQATC